MSTLLRKSKLWSIVSLATLALVFAGCVPTARLLVGISAGQAAEQAGVTVAEPVAPTNTPEPEPTATNTPAPTATNTPAPTATNTPEPEPTNTPEPEPTNTPEPEPTATAVPEVEPTATAEPEAEPTATAEPEVEPTATAEPEAEPTATAEPEAEPTATAEPEAEPTATAEPEVEPTATAEPEAESDLPVATVARPRVNLRTGPSTDFPIIRVVLEGESYPILAKNPAGDWYMLDRGEGQIGWISAPLVTVNGDAASIPVAADLPAAPEVTPTPASGS